MATEKGQTTNTANPILTRAATEDSVLRNYYSETYSQDKKVGLLVFRIGDGVFAIASLKTQEIIRSVDITRVPHLEKYILGITNLRGKILPICDLRYFFGLKNTIFDRDTRVIVAKFNQGSIGFVVDAVVDTIHIAVSSLEKNNSSVSSLQFDGFISGVCNHKDGIIFLLNILKVAGIESAPGESDPLDTFLNMLGDREGGKGLERSGGDGGGDGGGSSNTLWYLLGRYNHSNPAKLTLYILFTILNQGGYMFAPWRCSSCGQSLTAENQDCNTARGVATLNHDGEMHCAQCTPQPHTITATDIASSNIKYVRTSVFLALQSFYHSHSYTSLEVDAILEHELLDLLFYHGANVLGYQLHAYRHYRLLMPPPKGA